jgi:hypothetical protein
MSFLRDTQELDNFTVVIAENKLKERADGFHLGG